MNFHRSSPGVDPCCRARTDTRSSLACGLSTTPLRCTTLGSQSQRRRLHLSTGSHSQRSLPGSCLTCSKWLLVLRLTQHRRSLSTGTAKKQQNTPATWLHPFPCAAWAALLRPFLDLAHRLPRLAASFLLLFGRAAREPRNAGPAAARFLLVVFRLCLVPPRFLVPRSLSSFLTFRNASVARVALSDS